MPLGRYSDNCQRAVTGTGSYPRQDIKDIFERSREELDKFIKGTGDGNIINNEMERVVNLIKTMAQTLPEVEKIAGPCSSVGASIRTWVRTPLASFICDARVRFQISS